MNLLHNLKLFLTNNAGSPDELRIKTIAEMSVKLRKIVEGFSDQQGRLAEVQKALAHAEKLKVREIKKEQFRIDKESQKKEAPKSGVKKKKKAAKAAVEARRRKLRQIRRDTKSPTS